MTRRHVAVLVLLAGASSGCGARDALLVDGLPGAETFPGDAGVATFVAASAFASCAIDISNGVLCWGGTGDGELGNGTFDSAATPVRVSGLGPHTASVTGGTFGMCAVSDAGDVYCWGYDGASPMRSIPTQILGLGAGVQAVAAGGATHTCALTSGGGVLCWGQNDYGQLGRAPTASSSIPLAIPGLDSGVVALAAGNIHTCALTSGGDVMCWGGNTDGQLGNGTTTDSPTPVLVPRRGVRFTRLAAGNFHTCALADSGAVFCWGSNGHGQLGNGSTEASPSPVAVSELGAGILGLAPGGSAYHTCAWSVSTVWCWGDNANGELGQPISDGALSMSNVPMAVPGLGPSITAVAVGQSHTCALENGHVYCWGSNASGELGNSAVGSVSTAPVAVDGL